MKKDFYKAVEDRRSIYGIGRDIIVPESRIHEVINHAVKHTPTAFNSQTGRVVVLFGKHHDMLWDIAKGALKKIVPEDKFSSTEERINSFKSGYGTVLFFEDNSAVEALQEKFPLYKENFPIWSQQSSGTLQYIVWTSLENEGLGVSLQHYNPLIDEDVKKEWGIPESWKLIAQMPFGNPTEGPKDKEFMPIEERVKIFR